MITERGSTRQRLEDIAARLGLHPSTVLHYVSSKNELLAHALEFAEQRFVANLLEVLEGKEDAVSQLGVVIEWSSEPPGGVGDYALWLDIWSIARTSPEVHAARLRMDEAWRQVLEEIIRSGQERGELRGPPPPDAALAIRRLAGRPRDPDDAPQSGRPAGSHAGGSLPGRVKTARLRSLARASCRRITVGTAFVPSGEGEHGTHQVERPEPGREQTGVGTWPPLVRAPPGAARTHG